MVTPHVHRVFDTISWREHNISAPTYVRKINRITTLDSVSTYSIAPTPSLYDKPQCDYVHGLRHHQPHCEGVTRSPLTTTEHVIVHSRRQSHNPTIDLNGLHPEQRSIFDTAVFAAVFGPPKISRSRYKANTGTYGIMESSFTSSTTDKIGPGTPPSKLARPEDIRNYWLIKTLICKVLATPVKYSEFCPSMPQSSY